MGIETAHQMLDVIELIYGRVLKRGNWSGLLAKICDTFAADGGGLFAEEVPNKGDRLLRACAWPPNGHDQPRICLDEAARGLIGNIPLRSPYAVSGLAMTPAMSRLLDQLFASDGVPNGADAAQDGAVTDPSVMAGSSVSTDSHVLMIAWSGVDQERHYLVLVRSGDRPPFGQAARDNLAKIVRHLKEAMDYIKRSSQSRMMETRLTSVLDRLALPILLIKADRRILYKNQAACRVLKQSDVLFEEAGVLRVKSGTDCHRLKLALAAANGDGADDRAQAACGITLFGLPGGDARTALIRPTRENKDGTASEFLIVMDHEKGANESSADIYAPIIENIYNISPAEARVAAGLLTGKTLRRLSEDIGLSEQTIRTQSKHLYAKTGMKGQADLIRQMLTGPLSKFSAFGMEDTLGLNGSLSSRVSFVGPDMEELR